MHQLMKIFTYVMKGGSYMEPGDFVLRNDELPITKAVTKSVKVEVRSSDS